ncbi:helix-turn-helix domain-containing protein [Virgibacillus sp. CBA3643]
MENTLKLTNVLSDPTRYNIYQFIVKHHKEVSVVEIAGEFDIHQNVARLHLSKLEDINLVMVCNMHRAFLKGMFESLFAEIDLMEEENIFQGCENCTYTAKLSLV